MVASEQKVVGAIDPAIATGAQRQLDRGTIELVKFFGKPGRKKHVPGRGKRIHRNYVDPGFYILFVHRLDNRRVGENRLRRPGFTVHRHPAFFKFGSGGTIEEDGPVLLQFLFNK